jgi:hypothetical protein
MCRVAVEFERTLDLRAAIRQNPDLLLFDRPVVARASFRVRIRPVVPLSTMSA